MPQVVVIGAGLSGLAAAYRIQQQRPHAQVVVLEANSRPGGNVWTERENGYTIERGPNGFLDSKPSTMDLCRSLGIHEQLIAASEGSRKNRFLFLNDRLHKLPGSPLGILRTPLLSFGGKLKLLTEPFRARPHTLPDDESIADFARRRFGRETAETFIDALVTGIHGGDPAKLSVAAAFPRLPKFEREYGSVIRGFIRTAKAKRRAAEATGLPKPGPPRMWSFRDGLRVLIEALTKTVRVETNTNVRQLERTATGWLVRGDGNNSWPADAVVVTSPAHRQAELLAELDPALAADIASIRYTPIVVAVIGYKRTDVPHDLDGFGYIAPQRTRRDVLGVQWCSSIFPDRAPPGCVTWRVLCGGVNRPDVMNWDDATLLRKIHDEMKVAMKVRGEMVFHKLVRWPKAIPQYAIGHPARVARIEAAASQYRGLILGGNAYHGIAINDCTEQAERIAERVATLCPSAS